MLEHPLRLFFICADLPDQFFAQTFLHALDVGRGVGVVEDGTTEARKYGSGSGHGEAKI